jgi:hypothetical protein
VGHVGGDGLDTGLLEAEQEVGVAREADELGDEKRGAPGAALGER